MSKEEYVDQSKQFRARLAARLPKDLYVSNKYYIRTQIHSVLYLGIMGASYYYQQKFLQYPISYVVTVGGREIDIGKWLPYLLSPLFAFGITGTTMTGHDAQHNAMAPPKTTIGRIVNSVCNLFGYSQSLGHPDVINPLHMWHHRHVNTKEDVEMVLLSYGLGEVGMWLHTIWIVYRYNLRDIANFFRSFLGTSIVKTPIIGFFIAYRLFWYLSCSLRFEDKPLVNEKDFFVWNVYQKNDKYLDILCHPWTSALNISLIALYFKHFLFSGHLSVVQKNDGRDEIDPVVHELRNTISIYTSNSYYDHFQQFMHCGVTVHAVHHIVAGMPRSMQHVVADELRETYGDEFREINSVSEELYEYFNCVAFGSVSELRFVK